MSYRNMKVEVLKERIESAENVDQLNVMGAEFVTGCGDMRIYNHPSIPNMKFIFQASYGSGKIQHHFTQPLV